MRLNSFRRRLSLSIRLAQRGVRRRADRLRAFCRSRLSWRYPVRCATTLMLASTLLWVGCDTENCYKNITTQSDFAIEAGLVVGLSEVYAKKGSAVHALTGMVGVSHGTAKRAITGSDGSQTGTASFLGDYSAIGGAPQYYPAMVRQVDCSLALGAEDLSGSPPVSTTIFHYELVLHHLAQLTTTPDVFAKGCVDPATGISSAPGIAVGVTSQGVAVVAGAGTPAGGSNAVYLLTYSAANGIAQSSISSLSYASALSAADLNGDGNNDLVVVNGAAAPNAFVSVMLGNADGSFQTPVNYPTSTVAGDFSVAAALDDVNGDGKLDIVTVSADQQISVLLGNGDGTFQPAQTFAAPALPGYTSATQTPIVNLITADLRGIGRKDIIGSNGLVLLNGGNVSGNPTFAATAAPAFPYTQGVNSEGPNLASGDLNNDGKPDLVLSTGSGVTTWLGNGDGTFKQGHGYASINDTGFVTVTDIDGDGNTDIYVGLANGGAFTADDSNNNAAYVLMGRGDGTFAGAPTTSSGAYSGTNLGDVDGDGIPDLITSGVGQFTVQLGTGTGTFNSVSTITPPASFVLGGNTLTGANAGVSTYAVGDVNGDGFADLVFVDNGLTANGTTIYPTPVYFVALSNGDGTFKAPVPYLLPQIAPAGDFDNAATVSGLQIANTTGHADLVMTYSEQAGQGIGGSAVNTYNQGFMVLPGNGNGTFQTTPILTSTYSSNTAPNSLLLPQIVATQDLNGDSKADLTVINPSFAVVGGIGVTTTLLQVYLGDGNGSFQAPGTVLTTNFMSPTVAIADFNGDGKPDIASLTETSAGQAAIAISLNQGGGTFAAPTLMNLSDGDAVRFAAVAAADFNGDGQVDLAYMEPQAFSGVFYGNGDGTFRSVPIGTGAGSYVVPKDLLNFASSGAAIAVDLNKDGKPDILDGNISLLNVYGTAPVMPATSSTVLTSLPAATTITAGTSITFTATITPASGSTATPTGSVSFFDGTTLLGRGTVAAGLATYTTAALATGTHNIVAEYTGDANYSGSLSNNLAITVNAAGGAATTLTYNGPTTFTNGSAATLSAVLTQATDGTPVTGVSVLFTLGRGGTAQTCSGTTSSNGTATCSITTVSQPSGADTVSASFAGNSSDLASSAGPVAVTISISAAPSFTVTSSAPAQTVQPGGIAQYPITVTAQNGTFASPVTLTASGLPTGATYKFVPNPVTPGSSSASSTLSIQTATAVVAAKRPWWPLVLPAMGLIGLCFLPDKRRRRCVALTLLLFASLGALMALSGCGGGFAIPEGQTYTITVIGTSGTIQQATTVKLTVQ